MGSEKHRKLAEAARALNADHPAGLARGGRLPPLFFLTDEKRTPDPVRAINALPRECGVIFRHYDGPDRERLACEVAKACRAAGRVFVVAGDTALARKVEADGVHLPSHMLRTLRTRPHETLVTAAAHDETELRAAQELGVDAVLLSPVFATTSHSGAAILGVENFTALVKKSRLPVYALGGISDETASKLAASGAVGLAAIGGLL